MTPSQDHNPADLPHILVVDDDDRIRMLLLRYLTENGYIAFGATNTDEARQILALYDVDAMVLDVMMPGQDGVSFMAEIRDVHNDLPVLMLTAMGELDDRIKGLSAGVDDYLVKPFDPVEMTLRLQAIVRRSMQQKLAQQKNIMIGRWCYDAGMKSLQSDAQQVPLTDVEVRLLSFLAQNLGDLVLRDDLARHCGIDETKRTIDVQVARLRRKLDQEDGHAKYLQTVRGKGYILRGTYQS